MNRQDKVIHYLNMHKRLSTTQLASLIGMNSTNANIYLQELWEAQIIVGEVETNATYWRLP